MNTFQAIILARGNSKGIKNKNLIKINNKPLLFWTIKNSINSKLINQTWVSSDSDKILKYAKSIGAKTIKRPFELVKDNSSSESGWIHAAKFIDNKKINFENIVALQATSPIRSSEDLDKAIKFYVKKKYDSLFSGTEVRDHNIWHYSKNETLKANYNFKKRNPRQLIKPKYIENGSFYIFNKKKFYKENCRLFGKIGMFEINKFKSLQVDDYYDVDLVNALYKLKKKF